MPTHFAIHSFPFDWQAVTAFAVVAAAAAVVGRRVWGQVVAFRSRPTVRRKPSRTASPAPPRPQALIQIQTTAPRHMKRPSANAAHTPSDETRP